MSAIIPTYTEIDNVSKYYIIGLLQCEDRWINKDLYKYFIKQVEEDKTISNEEIYGYINMHPPILKDVPMRLICKKIGRNKNPIPACNTLTEEIKEPVMVSAGGRRKTRPYKNTSSSSKPRKSTRILRSRFSERVRTKSKRNNNRKTRKNNRRNNLRR